MNCKNCGLAIKDTGEYHDSYQTRYIHINPAEKTWMFYSCAYATRTSCNQFPNKDKYPYPETVATPSFDMDVALEFAQKVAGTLTSIKEPVAEKIIPVKVLPPPVGRRFR
jgi:hypothetical protein